jgi:two-component system, cell cycle sensor histidine kinase DivJ
LPIKSYFADLTSPLERSLSDVQGHVRLGVMAWHLGWSISILLAVTGLLFLPASAYVLVALIAGGIPGVCIIALLIKDSLRSRQLLIWAWGIGCLVAVTLTGGISGPLSAWVIVPLAAAVTLNQRRLISLGVSLSLMVGLLSVIVTLTQFIRMPGQQETFWLSALAGLTLLAGLGLALMPALRERVERAEDAEEARARLLRLLSEQPHLIVALDDGGALISAYGESPQGMDVGGLMKQGLVACAHIPDRPSIIQAINNAQLNGRSEIGFRPQGALDNYVTLSLRRAADNRLYGVLSDTSLSQARQQSLEAAKSEAETLNQGKSRFLASMSHELRTPLNAVIGFSDIMRQNLFGPMSEKYSEYAQLIWESGQHVLDLVNDVLDVSKIEAQKYDLSLETFDMREPVSAALRLILATAHDKSITLKSVLPPMPLEVTADKRAIKQMCLNLLSNAVKFTPKGGQISLILSEIGLEAVEIQITDTGMGIAPEDLSRLGQPYEQSGSLEQRSMGTGLGLSLVQSLTKLHKGQMSIESELGVGTSVSLILPIAHVPEQPELPLVPPMPPEINLEALVEPEVHSPKPLEDRLYAPPDVSSFKDFVIRPPKP